MTTFLYQDNRFYADTRAFLNGQPFNISGKVVPIEQPIRMKATLDKGSVKPIAMDDTIHGFFIIHAVEPGRALFDTMVESAKQLDGDVQNVVDNHERFIEVFKLAAYSTHFVLTLIGEKGTYSISTPISIDKQNGYDFAAYVMGEDNNRPRAMSYGANHEYMTGLISAGMPPIIAYYSLFLQFNESGGNVECWYMRTLKGKVRLVRDRWFAEASVDEMIDAVDVWRADPKEFPISDMNALHNYGAELLSLYRIEKYLEDQGYAMQRDEAQIVTHLVPKVGKPIDIQEISAQVKKLAKKKPTT
jgi:hypothetical protein